MARKNSESAKNSAGGANNSADGAKKSADVAKKPRIPRKRNHNQKTNGREGTSHGTQTSPGVGVGRRETVVVMFLKVQIKSEFSNHKFRGQDEAMGG